MSAHFNIFNHLVNSFTSNSFVSKISSRKKVGKKMLERGKLSSPSLHHIEMSDTNTCNDFLFFVIGKVVDTKTTSTTS